MIFATFTFLPFSNLIAAILYRFTITFHFVVTGVCGTFIEEIGREVQHGVRWNVQMYVFSKSLILDTKHVPLFVV